MYGYLPELQRHETSVNETLFWWRCRHLSMFNLRDLLSDLPLITNPCVYFVHILRFISRGESARSVPVFFHFELLSAIALYYALYSSSREYPRLVSHLLSPLSISVLVIFFSSNVRLHFRIIRTVAVGLALQTSPNHSICSVLIQFHNVFFA